VLVVGLDGGVCRKVSGRVGVTWAGAAVSCLSLLCGIAAAGHVDCARCLVEAGADVQADCDGCPALLLAVSTAVLPGRAAAALELVQLLLEAGADTMQRWAGVFSTTECPGV
jgi:hypothetical protein